MTFGAPLWFFALLIVPVLAGIFLRNEATREALLKKLVAARLLQQLSASASAARRRWIFALSLLGLTFVIIALTQPRFGYTVTETRHHGLDLMIAVDTSKSMLSTDVQPDRLTRAKLAAQDLIDATEGDRVGLIAFAGTSFVEGPLTIDYTAVESSLGDLDTSTIPRGGTNIASAIREAAAAFGKGESSHRALILYTDGEELEDDALAAAKEANGQFRIYTVGVGTAAGSLIPAPNPDGGTSFVKDESGQYVKSHLDEDKLKAIASLTGGFYIHLDNGEAAAKAILEQGLNRMQQADYMARETRPIDRYEWPLAAGIILLIASMLIRERRPVARKVPVRKLARKLEIAGAAVIAFALMLPAKGHAENQGMQLYDQKDYKGAYDTFQQQLQRDPSSEGLEFDRGAAAYKEGDFDKALDAFSKVLGSKDQALRGQAEYNIGNTLVERGALQEQKDDKIKELNDAVNHYKQALAADPKNIDAEYNKNLVEKMIDELKKNPPPQQQQQQNQQDQKNQQKQDQQQQNQQNSQQQQQNQQKQDQQQQSQQNSQQQQNQQGGQQQQNQQAQNQQEQNQQGGQQQQNQQAQNQQQQNQQGGQQQQNQQAQNQQQQNQQGGQQQQNQQAQNQQQQNQQGGQQQQNQQAQNQQQQGQKGGEQQNQQGTQGQQNQQAQNDRGENSNANGSPSPTPAGPGNLTTAQSQQEQQKQAAQAAARAANEVAKGDQMTPSQAQALVDSLRDQDEHVSLFDRTHRNDDEVYKDW
jgi:Ca-activated chloride channel homolog